MPCATRRVARRTQRSRDGAIIAARRGGFCASSKAGLAAPAQLARHAGVKFVATPLMQ